MQEANNVEIFPLFFGVLLFQQECPNQNGTALFKAGPVVALLLGCRRVVFFHFRLFADFAVLLGHLYFEGFEERS